MGQTPSDSDFAFQWGLLNDGQAIDGKSGIPGADISAIDAWNLFEPATDVIVAIVGAGVDPHPEFADRLLEGHVTSLAGGDPYSTLDMTGHGTRAAGIIAAARNNGVGVAGLNDRAWILPVRALNGNLGSEQSVAEGIVWAVDAGAKVVLVPLQLYENAGALSEALEHAYEHHVLVVAPVGHQPTLSVAFPAALANCLAVASLDNQDQVADFSNHGPEVDIAAPGVGIWSTQVGGGYDFESDPSSVWAAAYVAGVASLIWAQSPELGHYNVESILRESSVDDAARPGWDEYRGWGRLNASAALAKSLRPSVRFLHDDPQPPSIAPGVPFFLTAHVVDGVEQVVPGSVTAHVRYPGGQEGVHAMTPFGDHRYLISLVFDCEERFEFHFSAEGSRGSLVADPWQAPYERYQGVAVRERILFEDDFEFDLGWISTVEGAGSSGAWTRLLPVGQPTMLPPYDHSPDSGHRCMVTGTTLVGGLGSNDVDFGPVRLVSPPIALPSADVEVSYGRWFSTTSGAADSLVVEVSRDDGGTWHGIEVISQSTPWEVQQFRLSEFPSAVGNTLRLRFTASDLTNDSVTEAAVDDVRVVAFDCAAHRGDFDDDGDVDLSDAQGWTSCLSGPGSPTSDVRCLRLSTNGDPVVDLSDLQTALTAFGG